MKKKVFSCILTGALVLSALAGCGDKGGKQIDFVPSWNKDVLNGGDVYETLTYEVTFEAGAGLDDVNYDLVYGKGTYTATLQSISGGYRYETELSLPVSFTYGEETVEFTDTVKSTVVFHNARALTPDSSYKEVVSHTPIKGDVDSAEECYVDYQYTVTTEYGEDNEAISRVEYLETKDMDAKTLTREFTYGTGDYSYIDNEMLLLAMRAVAADTDSGKVKVFYPTADETEKIKFSFDDVEGGEFTHTLNGAALPSKEISYRAVTLSLSAENPGASQTAWIAACENNRNNANRNVLLRLETPLSYNFGKLTYTLVSVETI